MDTNPSLILLYVLTGAMWVRWAWFTLLEFLQLYVVNSTPKPNILDEIWTDEHYYISCSIVTHVVLTEFFVGIFLVIIMTIVLFRYLLSRLWKYSETITQHFSSQESEIKTSIVFVTILRSLEGVFQLTLQFYAVFIIEGSYGLNDQTILGFLFGQLIIILFQLTADLLFLVVLPNIFNKFGNQFMFFALWLVIIVINSFLLFVWPFINSWLMSSEEQLNNGELRSSIDKLLHQANYDISEIYVVESPEANAACVGSTGTIIVYQGLIDTLSMNETIAVLAHEIQHARGYHYLRLFVFKEIFFHTLKFLIAGVLYNNVIIRNIIYDTFNFSDSKPLTVGLVIFGNMDSYSMVPPLFATFGSINAFFSNLLRRDCESEADAFSVSLGYEEYLRTALMKLEEHSLQCPVSNWLYSLFTYNHPSLMERLEDIS